MQQTVLKQKKNNVIIVKAHCRTYAQRKYKYGEALECKHNEFILAVVISNIYAMG